MKKITFVTPWYGESIPGGAETALRNLVNHIREEGVEVEVLTTCVKQFSSDWNEDFYAEGPELINNVNVIRFRVRKRNTTLFDQINLKLMNGESICSSEEEIFLREMVNSPDLYQYIEDHIDDSQAFVFTPYMFGPTYYGCQKCLKKAVLIPCFHDESYFYFKAFSQIYSKVAGMIFLSDKEKELTENVIDLSKVKTAVLGTGVELPYLVSAVESFLLKYKLRNPFLLYAGRKDYGKNVDILIKYFGDYKRKTGSALKLVLIGGGEVVIPKDMKDEIIDLGFVSMQEKFAAYSSSVALCNPSVNESFSIVIMESWLCRRPVLVYDGCAVTKDFVEKAKGGLVFHDFQDFIKALCFFEQEAKESNELGNNGCDFVKKNFVWDVLVKKYVSFFSEIGLQDISSEMNRGKEKVDVEQIMKEIREEIYEKGYVDSIQEFATTENTYTQFNKNELLYELQNVNLQFEIPSSFPVTGRFGLSKRIFRKFCGFILIPTIKRQNEFNAHVTRCLNHLSTYISDRELKEEELLKKIDFLEMQLADLKKRGSDK